MMDIGKKISLMDLAKGFMQTAVCMKVIGWQINRMVKGNIYTTTEIYTKEDLKMAREAEQESTLLKRWSDLYRRICRRTGRGKGKTAVSQ